MFVQMVRHYKRKSYHKKERCYSPISLLEAIKSVQEGKTCKRVARIHIPQKTLSDHLSRAWYKIDVGCKPALLPEEELSIAQHLATFADHDYSFKNMDLRLLAKSFLDKAWRCCAYFKEHMPSEEC